MYFRKGKLKGEQTVVNVNVLVAYVVALIILAGFAITFSIIS